MHRLRRGTLAAALRALLVPTWVAAPIREIFALFRELVVGLGGLEPPTSRLSGVRSNRLSYKPIIPDQVLTLAPAPLDGRSLRRLRALLVPSQKAAPFSGVCSDCPATLSLPFRFRSIAGLCVQTQSAGGDKRDRTVDLLLAKQALSQLSYTPMSLAAFSGTFLFRLPP